MTSLEEGARPETHRAITGRVVPCPHCEMPTGVPLPWHSTRAETADEADGMSPTRCPDCDTRFEVHYTLG